VFFLFLVFLTKRSPQLLAALRQPRLSAQALLSGCLIAANWFVYIYAVQSGRVMESSLGYFINPLVNVAIGTLLLSEKLSKLQWWAIALAATGVAILMSRSEQFPWIAVTLAISFSLYALVRKKMQMDTLVASTLESCFLAFPAAICVLYRADEILLFERKTHILLTLGGVVTAVPLLLFALAAKRLPLSTLGFVQYFSPTIMFFLAVYLYGEPFTATHQLSFGCIWTAIALYVVGTLKRRRQVRKSLQQP